MTMSDGGNESDYEDLDVPEDDERDSISKKFSNSPIKHEELIIKTLNNSKIGSF